MRRLVSFSLLLVMTCQTVADEALPDLALLLFIAEFTDEQGNWNAPEIEAPPPEKSGAGEEP